MTLILLGDSEICMHLGEKYFNNPKDCSTQYSRLFRANLQRIKALAAMCEIKYKVEGLDRDKEKSLITDAISATEDAAELFS